MTLFVITFFVLIFQMISIKSINNEFKRIVLWTCVKDIDKDIWEGDYIREIFPLNEYYHISMEKFINSSVSPHIIVFNSWNSGYDNMYSDVRDIIIKHNVSVLIHLSDEFMNSKQEKYIKYSNGIILYQYVKYVFRQYSLLPYITNDYNINILKKSYQLPLGYVSEYLNSYNNTLKLYSTDVIKVNYKISSSSRKYMWSFIGDLRHGEREEAIRLFQQWSPYYLHNASLGNKSLKPYDMRKIYTQSKFVFIGKGFYNIDCFRIYEAIIAGALPIIITNTELYYKTFYYNNDIPKFIYGSNITEVIKICKSMSNDEIDIYRKKLTIWYLRQMNNIYNKRMELFPIN